MLEKKLKMLLSLECIFFVKDISCLKIVQNHSPGIFYMYFCCT